jgi:hypothetical protein
VLAEDGRPARESCVAFNGPAAEFAGIAAEVAASCGEGLLPRDILVAVPNGVWGSGIIDALASEGIRAVWDGEPAKVKGDPRRLDNCGNLRLATFLRLFLDPDDAASLRSWLGYGDWLLRSDAFCDLMAYARERELGITDVLDGLLKGSADSYPASLAKFSAPLEELDGLLKACRGISRPDAVTLFAQHGMALDERMTALLGPNPEQADIAHLARHAFAFEPPAEGDAVIVSPFLRCCGRRARATFITGLVNGFLPSSDAVDDFHTIDYKNRALARQRTLFEAIRATASEKAVYSFFRSDRLVSAESQGMQVTRVFIRGSERHADVAPSVFIPSY